MNRRVIYGIVIFLIGVVLNLATSIEGDRLVISLGPIFIGLTTIVSGLVDEKRSREKNAFIEKASSGLATRDDWLKRGVENFRFQEYGEAIKAFDNALNIDGNYVDAWMNKGSALHELGMYQDAIEAYDQAIRIEPKNANAWKRKGFALKKLDLDSEAKDAFSKAEELGYR
ncbi:MAG TPA: tetratricopeptide repeat protein [Methanothrix sp.]|jgi:tetratricopeptide (TPR) repeat protein|uniref:tetratricopeptide repeat protein n=3 Tax=Methanothrix sp. TaxID=90426 RepID=UPI002C46488C|nr:tetratricopeptide repeat protein [Methanothrix sp.]MDI9417772.1 tetratricopeptide repeat protein [Euryarchaeota archaeon]HON37076.1 tetratricopeptide repeat protein [Methanothrix sp.]HRU76730.1 tetratricopeptide repeat protein [Methanothrix sp.]